MPSAASLIGLGEAPRVAGAIGNTVSSKTGVGTAQVGATPITTNFTILTSTSGQTAAILPATEIGGGPYIVAVIGGTTATIFPPSGNTIAGAAGDAKFDVGNNKTAMFFKTTATAWVVNLSA